MSIEILDVRVVPYTRYWESDKNKNRWQDVGNRQFRYRVTLKLKIDGKVVEVYKDTKNFRISQQDPCVFDWIFAEQLLKHVKRS
jgi:hypothetical protein